MFFKSAIAACLLVLFALGTAAIIQPSPVPAIAQNNALESRVKALETAQVALLKRVSALEKPAVASTPVVAASASVTATKGAKDDLGISYSLDTHSDELEVTEWTAYQNPNGQLEFAGEIALNASAKPVNQIDCVVKMYKANKLIKVGNAANLSFRLVPGGTNRFDEPMLVKPSDIDRYTVEFKIIR